VRNLQALAREHTEEAIDALVAALKHPATRVSAATALLDRGYGKPVQTLSHRVIRSVADLTDQELDALLASEDELDKDQARH
jgi:HEAT repeat protein